MEDPYISYKDGIRLGLEEIAKNPNSIFLGYNVKYGRAGGFLKNVPEEQLFETPVAENLMMGLAIGLSLQGFLPVVYYERFDFVLNALDAMVNHLDKISDLSKKEFNPKVIIRVVIGNKEKPFFTGLTHTQDFTKAVREMVKFPIINFGEIDKNMSGNNILKIYKMAAISSSSAMIIEEKDKY